MFSLLSSTCNVGPVCFGIFQPWTAAVHVALCGRINVLCVKMPASRATEDVAANSNLITMNYVIFHLDYNISSYL